MHGSAITPPPLAGAPWVLASHCGGGWRCPHLPTCFCSPGWPQGSGFRPRPWCPVSSCCCLLNGCSAAAGPLGDFWWDLPERLQRWPFSGLWVRIIRWRPSRALAWKPDLATALGLKYLGAIVGLLGREVPGLYPETLVPGPGDADVVLQNAQATSERN